MENEYKGSSWHIWDLHVHTPISIEQEYGGNTNDAWDKYITDLENLPTELKVLGINDYFTIEGYKKVKAYQENEGKLKDRVLFPVIELRVRKFGNISNKDSWKRVNLHVIFDNTNINLIESQFLNVLEIDYKDIYHKRGLTKENIIELGNKIIERTPEDKRGSMKALATGFSNLNFDHQKVCKLLEDSGLNYFIALGKTEWETLRWDGSVADKLDVLNHSDFLFTAAKDIKSYNKSREGLKNQNVTKILLDCSDAHHLSTKVFKDKETGEEKPINERIGNCFTWIKTDLTFEGLRQITYEPSSRIKISDTKPIFPVRRIDSVKLSFPEKTQIAHKDPSARKKYGKENTFCFYENEISFSPYFTCLIGGRGSGKSTILNLIAEKIIGESDFFIQNQLRNNSREITPSDYVEIEGTTNEIEFISQNQIERFAGSGELTDAIYDRIKHYSDFEKFTQFEDKAEKLKELIDNQIKAINTKYEKEQELISLTKTLENDKKIIQSQKDEKYKEITSNIKSISEQIKNIEISRENYFALTNSLKNIIVEFSIEDAKNKYDEEIEKITSNVSNLLPETNKIEEVEKVYDNFLIKKEKHKKELDEYLQKIGVSEEQINDYERATSNISENNYLIRELKKDIEKLNSQIQDFIAKGDEITKVKTEIEQEIIAALQPLNEQLKSSNRNVSDIRFEYEFNEDSARDKLFEEFMLFFNQYNPSDYKTRRDSIKEYLFCIHPLKIDDYNSYMSELIKWGRNTNAQGFIESIFENKVHFDTYKLQIRKFFNDVESHKKVTGFYDNKELQNCSFGQRCTAVIVALLMFGNKPLLIDEPEAHLDSKLIAEYLVTLIKEKKKNRQIIFATHNANFVVNGDSELIQVLEINPDNKTITTPITIENIEHRELLLALEGGKEAFELRNNKIVK